MIFSLAACGGGSGEGNGGDAEMVTYKVAMEPTFPPFDTTNPETGDLFGSRKY